MIGFEQVLLQVATVANGTATEIAGDAFLNSISSLMGAVTALVIAVAGIITAVIAARSNGRTRTKQEEQAVAAAEAVQLVMQKLQENEARLSAVGKATLTLATTDEQRKQLDEQVAPVLNTSTERIEVINAQIPAIKEILGVKTADVNKLDIPRESDATLRVINEQVAKTKSGAIRSSSG
jgi:type II secretory pathway pseudopilin PulG